MRPTDTRACLRKAAPAAAPSPRKAVAGSFQEKIVKRLVSVSAWVVAMLGCVAATAETVPNGTTAGSPAAQAAALVLKGRTELPGYSGDFDHFAVDLAGNRLFLAAEDHGTLEVFDLKSGQHLQTVKGVETPHSIFYMPDRNRLLVTDSGTGMTKVLNASTY